MCLKPQPLPAIPEQTRQLAHELYPAQHLFRLIGDEYANLLRDEDFADLYSPTGQPALSPALLSLITVLQANEHLWDRRALEMVRSRIDWKYALHLPLNDRGFHPTVLCEFRQRLVEHEAQRRVLEAFLQRFEEKGLLQGRKVQRTDSMAVLGAVRELNRLELVMETLRLALEALAREDPHWLAEYLPAEWLDQYGEWTQAERIVSDRGAKGAAQTQALLRRTGADGFRLLEWLEQPGPSAV